MTYMALSGIDIYWYLSRKKKRIIYFNYFKAYIVYSTYASSFSSCL